MYKDGFILEAVLLWFGCVGVVACGFGLYAWLHRRLRGWHPLLESEPIPVHVTVLRADDPDAGEVRALAVAADGSLVSGAWDATLRVWRDGACVRTLSSGYMGDVNAVAAFGASRLLSGSDDGSARLWTADGTLERAYEMGSSSAPSSVLSVAGLPDGAHLVVGGDQGGVRLFHVDGTLVHKRPKAHAAQVFALTATPDGAHVVSGSFDQRIKGWSVASRGLVGSCDGHTAAVWAVAALADGERLLSGSADKTVRVWRLAGDGSAVLTISSLHTADVTALAPLPDGRHSLSASFDKTVALFRIVDGAGLRRFTHHTGSVYALALLPAVGPDGSLRFASGGDDRTVRIVENGLVIDPADEL